VIKRSNLNGFRQESSNALLNGESAGTVSTSDPIALFVERAMAYGTNEDAREART